MTGDPWALFFYVVYRDTVHGQPQLLKIAGQYKKEE